MNCEHKREIVVYTMTTDGRSWWDSIVCQRCWDLLRVVNFQRRQDR